MLRLAMLSIGSFIWLVTEVMPIGLLTDIAQGLGVSSGQAGLLVTGYAWLVALTAIPLTALTSGIDRRIMIAGLLALAGVVDILSAFVSNFTVMALLRITLAFGHGLFWSTVAGVAVRLAPHMPVAKAAAWVFTGVAMGFAIGVPLISAIGQWFGWRMAFAFCGVGAFFVCAGFVIMPPALPSPRKHFGLPPFTKEPKILFHGGPTFVVVLGHFTAYAFVGALVLEVTHSPQTLIPSLLLVYGIAGIAGNWLSGRALWGASRVIMIAVWGLLATYTLLLLCGHSTVMVWVNMVLWGMAASALNMAPQSYAMELAPSEREAACSFSVTGFNAGVGAGALLGGTALSTLGVHSLPIMSSALGFLALIVLYWGKRFTPTKTA